MFTLYYNGKIVGVITHPDNYPGGIQSIVEMLSPDEGLAIAEPISDEAPEED